MFFNLLKAVTPTEWINSSLTGYYFESGLDDLGCRSLWSIFWIAPCDVEIYLFFEDLG